MNLGSITDFVTSKVGQTDDRSKELCRGFVQARYAMLYDSFAWRDSEMTSAVSLQSGVTDLPLGMDRVIAIRADGSNFLDPVDTNLLMQTDPGIFERNGTPTCYREFTDFAGGGGSEIPAAPGKKIQFYPTPLIDVALFIVGKRALTPLVNNTDTPILRNVDNCLIAYAMSDMLERQRQYDKAKSKFEEAAAMLTAAQAVETGQADQPRRSKQLTSQGNSLAELTDQVCAITGQYSRDSIVLAKNFLRNDYQMIWDACNWSEATVAARVNTDGQEVILPSNFDRIISIRSDTTGGELSVDQPSVYFGVNPGIFEQTGTPISFSYLTSVGVAALPPQREKLSIFSTSSRDRGNMFLLGELKGSEVSENIVLNGTVPVPTGNQYDTPLTAAKGLTVGDVRIVGFTSGVLLQTILSSETERRHMRIWLQPAPDAARVCLILGKRTINPFAQDEDTPLLRGISASLIAYAASDMFTKLGNDKAAAAQQSAAEKAMNTLVSLETQQGAFSARVIPYTDGMGSDGYSLTKRGWM